MRVEAGTLRNYQTNAELREASEAETLASIRAAISSPHIGTIEVDGVVCYVDGGWVVDDGEERTAWSYEGYYAAVIGDDGSVDLEPDTSMPIRLTAKPT